MYEILTFLDQSTFLASLLSNALVVLLIGIGLPAYLFWLKRPSNLEFFFDESGESEVCFTKKKGDLYEYEFDLIIRHSGGHALVNGIYWHMYVPEFINIEVAPIGVETLPGRSSGNGHLHLYGLIEKPIFSGVTHRLHYRFKCNLKMTGDLENGIKIPLLYFFNTEFGNFPKSLSHFKKKSGIIDPSSLAKIYLIV